MRNVGTGDVTCRLLDAAKAWSLGAIIQLALSGEELSEQQLNDIGLNFLRTQLVTVPGASVPYPAL